MLFVGKDRSICRTRRRPGPPLFRATRGACLRSLDREVDGMPIPGRFDQRGSPPDPPRSQTRVPDRRSPRTTWETCNRTIRSPGAFRAGRRFGPDHAVSQAGVVRRLRQGRNRAHAGAVGSGFITPRLARYSMQSASGSGQAGVTSLDRVAINAGPRGKACSRGRCNRCGRGRRRRTGADGAPSPSR